MKNKFHLFGAIFGSVCAVAFTIAPFVAGADTGPLKDTRAVVAKSNAGGKSLKRETAPKKRMDRGNVAKKDDGCED